MIKGIILVTLVALTSNAFSQIDIYTEDFSGTPVGFTIVDNDGLTPNAAVSEFTEAWIQLADPDSLADTVMGSTSFFDPIGIADRWLITPAITLGSYGNRFYWEAKSHDASFPDDYYVLISTTDTQLSSFTDTIGYIIEEFDTWTLRDVDLTANGYNDVTVHIAFVNRTYDGFKLYIDDIRAEKENDLSLPAPGFNVTYLIYPNPTKGQLFVSVSEFMSLEIISLDGISLITSKEANVDLSDLPNGIYFVRIRVPSGELTQRFIKN